MRVTLANCKQRIVVIGSGTGQQSLVLSFRLQFSSLGRLGPGLLRWVTNDGPSASPSRARPPAEESGQTRADVVKSWMAREVNVVVVVFEKRKSGGRQGGGPPSFSVPFQNKNVTVRVPAQCAAQLAFTDCRTTVRAGRANGGRNSRSAV